MNSADYTNFVHLQQEIVHSVHGRPAFRMGGILWRLAMESVEVFDEIIVEVLNGPKELGPTGGEYLFLNGNRFYDHIVKPVLGDTICGVHGFKTGLLRLPAVSLV